MEGTFKERNSSAPSLSLSQYFSLSLLSDVLVALPVLMKEEEEGEDEQVPGAAGVQWDIRGVPHAILSNSLSLSRSLIDISLPLPNALGEELMDPTGERGKM